MHSPGLDDSELLRRARVDANAFAAFYRRHARAVYRSLLSDCGDPGVALDLTAETFARALQSLGRLRGPRVTSGRSWIFAIANSLFLQYERERRTEGRAPRRLGILEATRMHVDEGESVVARIEDEATYDEIALQLGCSPAAARRQGSLGSVRGFTGTLIVRFDDGTVRRIPLRAGGSAAPRRVHLRSLPGMMPAANAAA